jgi:hypothetical protein
MVEFLFQEASYYLHRCLSKGRGVTECSGTCLKVSSTASGEDVLVGITVVKQNAWMSIKRYLVKMSAL